MAEVKTKFKYSILIKQYFLNFESIKPVYTMGQTLTEQGIDHSI